MDLLYIYILYLDPTRARFGDTKSTYSGEKENMRGILNQNTGASRGGHRNLGSRSNYQHQGGRAGGGR